MTTTEVPAHTDLDELLAELTLPEKIALLSGADLWSLPAVARLGIDPLVVSDGPAGVRGSSFMSGRSVSFPCQTSLAASWDPQLVREVGVALGLEARRLGVHVLLAPTINLHRHPLAGRNFECFSEDPFLTSSMAVAYIDGVQATGVGCCVKHLVCNESEFERHTINSVVDEVTLRETYLAPFQAAVGAGVWSVMASYNKLNGTHTTENSWLLDDVLRGEWGFDGVVVSDWWATQSTAQAMAAGLDLEMPGPSRLRGDHLRAAVDSGQVAEADVDRSVRRVLRLIERTTAAPPTRFEPDAASRLARRAGARGIVLLKNTDSVLPLTAGRVARVAVIGPGADLGRFQGGGSAQVNPEHVVGIVPALSRALGTGVDVQFERGCVTPEWARPLTPPMAITPDGVPGVWLEYHLRDGSGADPLAVETSRQMQVLWVGDLVAGHPNENVVLRARADLHPSESGSHELVVSATGSVRLLVDGEVLLERTWDVTSTRVFGVDDDAARVDVDLDAGVVHRLEVEFAPKHPDGLTRFEVSFTPPNPPDLRARAVALAAQADVAVVVAESPHGWESEGRDRLDMTLPGEQDALIAEVAAANPATVVVLNTGVPVTMPWVDDVAAVVAAWFPGQELGDCLADVLTGAVNPSGRLPMTFPRRQDDVASDPYYPGADGTVTYTEGANFGYRHALGANPPAPLFPFGHGMSYSTFSLGRPTVAVSGTGDTAEYDVQVPVRHEGGPAGRQVVQLYVCSGRVGRPARELRGYAAADLEPGQSQIVHITVNRQQLRVWEDGRWQVPRGPVLAYVGTSAADLPHELELSYAQES